MVGKDRKIFSWSSFQFFAKMRRVKKVGPGRKAGNLSWGRFRVFFHGVPFFIKMLRVKKVGGGVHFSGRRYESKRLIRAGKGRRGKGAGALAFRQLVLDHADDVGDRALDPEASPFFQNKPTKVNKGRSVHQGKTSNW